METGTYIIKQDDVVKLPRTHERGTKCIDFAIASIELKNLVMATGYLPFYSVGMSDHRAMYLDLDYKQLFKGVLEDKSLSRNIMFTTKKKAPLEEYLNELKTSLRRAGIFDKMKHLREEFETYNEKKHTL